MKEEIDDLTKVIDTFGMRTAEMIEGIMKLMNIISEEGVRLCEALEDTRTTIDEAKQIAILEELKKHCKNYLELKQINRELNILKFKKGRKIK